MERVIIIGNSGSGKTYLANRMSNGLDLEVIQLDDLFWEPAWLDRNPPEDMQSRIIPLAQNQSWIAEGISGELAREFFHDADTLIWLDMDWATCMSGLRARHAERSQFSGQDEIEESFRELLKWASEYWQRLDLKSYKGHQSLFMQFKGRKIRLASRKAIENFLDTIPQKVFE